MIVWFYKKRLVVLTITMFVPSKLQTTGAPVWRAGENQILIDNIAQILALESRKDNCIFVVRLG